ncbi:hypothetical protein FXO37_15633 [Capsicum annuum]|nr:hypothetical protein FXO37_15633 [Capsicum annuum]
MISQPICRTDDPELLHKAASRVGSDDNCLYSTTAKDATEDDALLHFRRHWAKGKPVIVRNVLEHTSGLSWEPMVMWRKKKQKFTGSFGREIGQLLSDGLDIPWDKLFHINVM